MRPWPRFLLAQQRQLFGTRHGAALSASHTQGSLNLRSAIACSLVTEEGNFLALSLSPYALRAGYALGKSKARMLVCPSGCLRNKKRLEFCKDRRAQALDVQPAIGNSSDKHRRRLRLLTDTMHSPMLRLQGIQHRKHADGLGHSNLEQRVSERVSELIVDETNMQCHKASERRLPVFEAHSMPPFTLRLQNDERICRANTSLGFTVRFKASHHCVVRSTETFVALSRRLFSFFDEHGACLRACFERVRISVVWEAVSFRFEALRRFHLTSRACHLRPTFGQL